jgi:hypothetical protein
MTITIAFLLVLSLLAAVYLVPAASVYRRFRGRRLVTCPESGKPAAVEVNATHLALSTAAVHPELHLATCSRWPERAGCGQECLHQIEAAPEDCLLRTILTRWYEDKACAFCGKSFAGVESWGHKTALLAPSGETVEWDDVRAETLPALFATHRPVCWNCHVAEAFRRRHPELVTDRPAHHGSH